MCDPCALPHNFLKLDKQVLSAPRRTERGRRVGTGLLRPEASDSTDSKLPDGGLALRVVAGDRAREANGAAPAHVLLGCGCREPTLPSVARAGDPQGPGATVTCSILATRRRRLSLQKKVLSGAFSRFAAK